MTVLNKKKLSVIFAFYNEADCINSAINEITSCLSQLQEVDYELIFVNDCSTEICFTKKSVFIAKSDDHRMLFVGHGLHEH